MKKNKRARLEGQGWRVGSAADFLELSPEEAAFVETKLALSQYLGIDARRDTCRSQPLRSFSSQVSHV